MKHHRHDNLVEAINLTLDIILRQSDRISDLDRRVVDLELDKDRYARNIVRLEEQLADKKQREWYGNDVWHRHEWGPVWTASYYTDVPPRRYCQGKGCHTWIEVPR